ncbi:bifunctional folylpolyglutamate synthase/dihydrofolate synthase [Pseudobutyrivibrio xylanivorans]|uniref:tetrahydrofolate synthase n=1 Tax=Pseudobutyrivibrio xylanivorans TaxID=185007 RepID=A0A5P6VTM3_PSEXY|nr:folylpolyglutamate synthase/dihydrofolate synthase family protein [Pseudobutyrivibrio xylanivorans]QFJ55986.1 bifunctional folylpolyglutamate synthase/dihydrofolate synthase [Pseudobutyrivibrio xylanivorans]
MDNGFEFLKNLPHFVPPKSGGKRAADFFSLDAELALLKKLGNPHQDLKYIHVAGTNGKGSTSAFIASILKEAGLKVGLFTSPFLYAYNEMFRVNGNDISDEDFNRIFSCIKPAYDQLASEGIYPSEYEILTVMSFLYFKEMGCDIVVMEVSLGGRVDTTNVIPSPLVTVITPISYDHMTILGDTLAEIASEKAGIIKSGTVVVSAQQEEEVQQVLSKKCEGLTIELSYCPSATVLERSLSGQSFKLEDRDEVFETKLLGTYQIKNAALAIMAAEKLRGAGYDISKKAIVEGIRNTEWFGRFSLLQNNPPVIIDGGHNRQGAKVLADSLREYFPDKKITFILGILKDKEVDIMLDTLLPLAEQVFTVAVPNQRTMQPEDLAEMIQARGCKAEALTDADGISSVIQQAEVVCIAGSLYLPSGLVVD